MVGGCVLCVVSACALLSQLKPDLVTMIQSLTHAEELKVVCDSASEANDLEKSELWAVAVAELDVEAEDAPVAVWMLDRGIRFACQIFLAGRHGRICRVRIKEIIAGGRS